jgi:uncharacterized RDD family membrane protein YckC
VSDLVTGEGVALDLHLAKLASRSVAFAIDVLVQFVALAICYAIVFSGPGQDRALVVAVALVIAVAVLVGYPVLFETLSKGRTLGKLALGLRVVRDDGGPIRFRHALVRGLAGFFVDFWALGLGGFVALIVSLSSKQGKRVGDYLAGTVVIRQRVPRTYLDDVYMPPQLSRWAADLDLSGLPDDLALAARQYLGRLRTLELGAGHDLGYRLAAQVSHSIGTPIPPGASTREFLAAVVAERRRREQARVNVPVVEAPPPSPYAAPSAEPPRPDDNPFAPPG